MATIFSHALVGATIVAAQPKRLRSPSIYIAGAITAMLPDIDYLGYINHVSYGSLYGHRGFTHSLLFALFVAIIMAVLFRRKAGIISLFFVTTLSHSLIDACTDGGLGVAFFAPFSNARYFFPWRPILVSPMGPRFFSEHGLEVLGSEAFWIGIPCGVILLLRFVLSILNRK